MSDHIPRKRVHLDRDIILATARDIFQSDGLETLTLRRLGRELGVDATAMYRHFRNKGELVTALIDELFTEIEEPDQTRPWRSNLRELMTAWWNIYRQNEGYASAIAGQPDDEPRLSMLTEWTLRELNRAGVPHEHIGLLQLSIYNLVVGHGLVAAFSPWLTDDKFRREQQRISAALDPDLFPHTTSSASQLFPTPEATFMYSVELLLDTIEERGTLAGTSR